MATSRYTLSVWKTLSCLAALLSPASVLASVTLNAVPVPRSEPSPALEEVPPPPVNAAVPWYETIGLRGYTQFRYNRLPSGHRNDQLINAQGDRSIGAGNGFSMRRARVILFGDLHRHISIYFQPDFASVLGTQHHMVILRDWYTDIFFDSNRTFRLRLGQSKVPYGFENLQSSQNRLPLDRNDALNSAVKDERDIGAFLYWSPMEAQQRFRHLVQSGLKGSGDYGVVGLGIYNGQTANQPALSDDLHAVFRMTYPFLFGSQFVEFGGGGYIGKYQVPVNNDGTTNFRLAGDGPALLDARAFATLVFYPQPFGFAAEGTYGVGPSQGRRSAADREIIDSRPLWGGYAQLMYKIDGLLGTVAFIPFARATYYDGGKKFMANAPHYVVKELELGLEWQIIRALEIVLAYDIVERTSDRHPYHQEFGHVTRVQVQVNYP